MNAPIGNRINGFYSSIKRSRDGKRIVKNFGYLLLLEVATHLFPLITLPYLGRVIGVEGFGLLAIGTAVISYVQAIIKYGFDYSSVRDVARYRDSIGEVSKIVSLTFFTRLFLMLVSILVLGVCCLSIPFLRDNSLVIWCTFLLVPGVVLNPDWVFQAFEDMHFITIRNLVAKTITTGLVFLMIKHREDYFWQPILEAIGVIIPSLMGIYMMHRKYGIRIKLPSIKAILDELKKGFNMFITMFLPTVYTHLNVLLLGSVQGTTAAGVYNGGTKFTSLAFSFFRLISRTVYPHFSRKMNQHSLYVRVSLLISLCMSLVLFIFAKPLVYLLLGPEFGETVKVLRIVAFTPVAMSLMNSYGVNYLVLKNRERLMSRIIVFVTIIGLALGITGAILFSYVGVAIASLTTQFIRAGLISWYARKIAKNSTCNE